MQVARETAWRKAVLRWTAVVSHRLSECNDIADSQSRLSCPTHERKSFPPVLKDVPESHLPPEEAIWETWTETGATMANDKFVKRRRRPAAKHHRRGVLRAMAPLQEKSASAVG